MRGLEAAAQADSGASASTLRAARGARPPARRRRPSHAAAAPPRCLHTGVGEPAASNGAAGAAPAPWAPLSEPAPRPPRLVQTQRGETHLEPPPPEDPCPDCGGCGRARCVQCHGKGRLNYRAAAALPSGVWPEWCMACRASGRSCCAACLGTGARREPIGFRID
jgi:hypothetical protein